MSEMPQIIEKTQTQIEAETQNDLPQFPPDVQRAVHMWMSGSYRIKEIASITGRSAAYIRSVLKHPEVKEYIQTFQKEEDDLVKQAMNALRMKALYKLNDLLDSDDDNVAAGVAKDILNRTGFAPVVKKDVSITHKSFEEKMADLDKSIDAEYSIVEE